MRTSRYELIHGVLVVTPPPLEEERGPNEARLGGLLYLYRMQHPQGSALDDTLSEQYVSTQDSIRRADPVIWAGLGRAPNPRKDFPTIVVEFVSEGKRQPPARLPRETRRVPCGRRPRIPASSTASPEP